MKFCAFLRGVNVKGTNMKMAEVCKVFEDVGMKNVSSVLASGNIIFSSDQNEKELKEILEKAMSAHFDYEAFLFIKNYSEIETIFKSNPFQSNENLHIYSFVCIDGFENTLISEFEKASKATHEDAKLSNGYFYWQVPKGNTLDSTFGKILGKKSMKDQFTSRNLNTFEKIIKKIHL